MIFISIPQSMKKSVPMSTHTFLLRISAALQHMIITAVSSKRSSEAHKVVLPLHTSDTPSFLHFHLQVIDFLYISITVVCHPSRPPPPS